MRHLYGILFLFMALQAQAQLETAHWRFGWFGGLNFTSGTASVASGNLHTNEGCASISDKCGNLLFYTDGKVVFSKDTSMMQNGNALLGDASSTQSAIIIPKADNPNIYYVFTTYSLNGLHYSVIDMSLNGGLGAVVAGQKNIPLALNGVMKGSEKLTAVAKADNSGYWVITHYLDSYYAFSVTAAGVNTTPVRSQIGVNIPDKINNKLFLTYAIGQLKVSPDGSKIAAAHFTAVNPADFNLFPIPYFSPSCALAFTYGGMLGLYDFDNQTGIVSNESILNSLSNERRTYYGVEFSPDSKVLYSSYDVFNFASDCGDIYTTYKVNAVIDKYDLTAASVPATENHLFQNNDPSKSLAGSLQLALDGNIYHAMYSSLSYISNPNNYGASVFHNSGIPLSQTTLGLPPFIASLFDPKILINGEYHTDKFCLGTNMAFRYEGCPDTIIGWDFGDGNTTTSIAPTHTYANAGNYTITLTITAPNGTIETKTKDIEIVAQPNVQDAILKKCPDLNGHNITFDLTESYPLINPDAETVTFSFHLTEQEAKDDAAAQPLTYSTASPFHFWVRIENDLGCFSVVELELLFHEIPDFEIDTPLTICANHTAEIEIDTAAGNTVNWFDSQTATTPIFIGTNFTTPVLTSTTSYWITIFNGFCYGPRTEIIVDVLENPEVSVDTSHEICAGTSLILTATSDADTINWYLTHSGTVPDFTGVSFATASLMATTSFWVEAVNSTTGCKSDKTEVVVVVNGIVAPTFNVVSPICSGESLAPLPTVSLEGITGTWSPALDNLRTTTYTFTPAAGECATVQTLLIVVNPAVTPTFNPISPICFGTALPPLPTVSIEGIVGTWSPALDHSQTTTYTFAPNIGQCAIVQTLTIVVNQEITPTFNAVSPICFGTALTALPTISLEGITGTWLPALDQTQTTTYTFSPDAGQCATTQTLTIVVNRFVTPTFNAVPPICSGATVAALPTVSLEGITGTWTPALDNLRTTTYTFSPDAGQCATTQTLTIAVNSSVTPTFNAVSPICFGATLAALPTVSLEGITGTWAPALDNLRTTTYTFSADAGQCAINQTLTIVVNSSVTPTFNAISPICFGTALPPLPTVSLEGITGTWTPALDNTQTTTYTFTPNSGQCAIGQTLKITVNPIVTATFNAVPPICAGTSLPALPSVSLEGITGIWTPALDNTQTTTYTFTPDAGQCTTTTAALRIVVNPVMTPVFAVRTNYCQNNVPDVLPVLSNNGVSGTWFPAQINTLSVGTATYVFSPDARQCTTGTVLLNITVNGSDRPVLNIATRYCQNAVADALPNVSDNGIIGTWSHVAIDTSVLGIQTYTFTPVPGACSVISHQFELTVEIVPSTTPVFELITEYYFVETPQLLPTVSDNGITGIWYPAVIDDSISATGTYRFVPDADQCAAAFSIAIHVINFPKFFTPNNDGYHDLWNISALESQHNAKILIYDRYGKILTTINAQGLGWDGTYNGQQLPSDDYWFVLTYLDREGLPREFKSHFTLKR